MGKKVDTETRYFVLLPTVEAHVNSHPTSGAAGFAQRVHPKISNTLVGEGITDVQEVKRTLRHHVLFPDPSNRPNEAYYPANIDIYQESCLLSKACTGTAKARSRQFKAQTRTVEE